MANKNELVAQLEAMGEVLGRELDISGTVADLELRIREAQEEIDQLNDEDSDQDNDNSGAGTGTGTGAGAGGLGGQPPAPEKKPDLVKVRPVKTLHIAGAWHETKNEPITMAIADKVIRVSPELADELVDAGQAVEVSDE